MDVDSRRTEGRDVFILPRGGDPFPFVSSPANENAAAFSLAGTWIAYVSDETGRAEIYVQPFPGRGRASRSRRTAEGLPCGRATVESSSIARGRRSWR